MNGSIDYYTHKSISDAVIRARMDHLNRMHAEELPDDPPLIIEDAVVRMRNLPSTSVMHFWVLRQDHRIVAQCRLDWATLDTNREAAGIDITVEPALRRRGIATGLMRMALEVAEDVKRPRLFAGSSDKVPAGRSFLETVGFRPKIEAHVNQLTIDQLDSELMQSWRAIGNTRARDYSIEIWDGPVPTERLAAFAELANVMNSAPRGDLEIEDTQITPAMIRERENCFFSAGNRQLISCARHVETGELAGYTELSWNPKRAAIVWQGDTGVVEAHRNRSLGRWLKATNIGALLRQNRAARFVRTGNADSNAPMLAINRKMGFVPFIAEMGWQGQLNEVVDRIVASAR